MTEESNIQKSLIVQIYEEMFRIIEKTQKLDEVEIQNLKKIAYEDNFEKEKSIVDAIKSGEIMKK